MWSVQAIRDLATQHRLDPNDIGCGSYEEKGAGWAGTWQSSVGADEVGAAAGAAQEHRACAPPEVGHEALEPGCVVPTAHAKVDSKLVERLGVGGEFGVPGFGPLAPFLQ